MWREAQRWWACLATARGRPKGYAWNVLGALVGLDITLTCFS